MQTHLPGRHCLADMYGIDPVLLDDIALLGKLLGAAIASTGLHAMQPPVVVRFPGSGATGFVVLAESHISFHTYPNLGYLALDVFTCGSSDPQCAVRVFTATLHPVSLDQRLVLRGIEAASHPPLPGG